MVLKNGVQKKSPGMNPAELPKIVRALRDVQHPMPADDAAFVADVDAGVKGPLAVLNSMTRRLWKTQEATAVDRAHFLKPRSKRQRRV